MSLFGDLPPPNKENSEEAAQFSTASTKDASPQTQAKSSAPVLTTSTAPSAAVLAGAKRPSPHSLQSQPPKKLTIGLSTLKGYVAERKGERADMQDAHVIMDDCTSDFPQFQHKIGRVSYYAVFDGHGGCRASTHCAKRMHQHFVQNLPRCDVNNFPKEMKKMILHSFKQVDEEFLKEASIQKPVWKDGTTACCVFVMDDTVYIINLGDSKAILCRYNSEQKKNVSIVLSKDHNPTDYDERQRIQKAGGQVREGRIMGILEVSRSIGDGQYKRCGVINVPDIKRCQLTSNDRFLLIACDGLWKVYSPDQAIEFVLHVLQDNSVQVPEGSTKTLEEVRFETACNRLASEAVRKGSADNVTVVLVSVSKL